MGVDAGFDMVPQLARTPADRKAWETFIDLVKERYKDDKRLEITPTELFFNAGEGPRLPFEGFKFLRFSSKVSGSTAHETGVGDIIGSVTKIAKGVFGSRIYYWSEARDQFGHYDWGQVRESFKSYEKVDGWDVPETGMKPSSELTSPKGFPSLYEVRSIAGKGKGLVALRKITKGTRILIEKPLLTSGNAPPTVVEPILAKKLKALTKTEQRQFLSLQNNFPGKYPFSGIVKTNALPCGPTATIGGVYPTICRINHSCNANSHNNWNENLKQETIHAIRDIEPGEEITIPYDRGDASTTRRPWLKETFGFDCDCSTCSLPPSDLRKSDARRQEIQRLDEAIGDPFRMKSNPGASLSDCRLLLQTIQEEYSGSTSTLSARANYDAFQIVIAHGDMARAAVFAKRAYDARVVCEGEDSPQTSKMKGLEENPSSHASFGVCSMRWRTKKGRVPKDLSEAEFEDWLWKRE